ncbi:hypothetical protein D3C75_1289840 [compost metagenome]
MAFQTDKTFLLSSLDELLLQLFRLHPESNVHNRTAACFRNPAVETVAAVDMVIQQTGFVTVFGFDAGKPALLLNPF